VHDRAGLVLTEYLINPVGIQDIPNLQRPPFYRSSMAAGQIIVADGQISGSGQGLTGMAADIAGTAGYNDVIQGLYPYE